MSCCPLAHLTFPWKTRFNFSFSFVCGKVFFFPTTGQGLEIGYKYTKCGGLIAKASISQMVCNKGQHFIYGGKCSC